MFLFVSFSRFRGFGVQVDMEFSHATGAEAHVRPQDLRDNFREGFWERSVDVDHQVLEHSPYRLFLRSFSDVCIGEKKPGGVMRFYEASQKTYEDESASSVQCLAEKIVVSILREGFTDHYYPSFLNHTELLQNGQRFFEYWVVQERAR